MTENVRKKAVEALKGAPQAQAGDLLGEIALLRAAIQQVSEEASALESAPRALAERLRVLDGLGRAMNRLANLLRTQRALEEEQTAAALSRALEEVNRKGREGGARRYGRE